MAQVDVEPAIPLTLPISAAVNLEAELLARFAEPHVSRNISMRRVAMALAWVGVLIVGGLAGLLWLGNQHTAATQIAALLVLAIPATVEKHLELRRLIQARAEIRRRHGLSAANKDASTCARPLPSAP